MPSRGPFVLPGWEGEVYLWGERDSSIMLVARTREHHDPVELTSEDARRLAAALEDAANELESEPQPEHI